MARTRAPIGVGLIGYGLAGSVLHGPLIDAEEGLQLQAVACGRPERVHRDFPAVRVVATPAELLEDPRVELVVVAAPNAAHYQLASLALEAGRQVVVEKPMVPRSSEADELIRLAQRQGRLLSVFHQRRWDGDFLTVQQCIKAGLLGSVSIYIARYDRYRPHPGVAGGSRIWPAPGSCTTSALTWSTRRFACSGCQRPYWPTLARSGRVRSPTTGSTWCSATGSCASSCRRARWSALPAPVRDPRRAGVTGQVRPRWPGHDAGGRRAAG